MTDEHTAPHFTAGVLLAGLTSYRIGGPSRFFFDARNVGELKDAVRDATAEHLGLFIIGGGTNVLASDAGFDGLVLRPSLRSIEVRGNEVRVGAGVPMAELVAAATEKSLSGLEWAGGLPGTVGGAVRGNAGCFGGETKDAVTSVRSLNIETLVEETRNNAECRFSYRSSIFKETNGSSAHSTVAQGGEHGRTTGSGCGGEIVTEVTFELRPGDRGKIRAAVEEKIDYRKTRHPMEYPNAGSVFKNVPLERVPAAIRQGFSVVVKTDPFPVVPAAYLIAEAGCVGMQVGGAMVSPKHPNFIVNVSAARAADVLALIERVKRAVREKFCIGLEEEVLILPEHALIG